jgi:hypothetical protein
MIINIKTEARFRRMTRYVTVAVLRICNFMDVLARPQELGCISMIGRGEGQL